MGVKGTFTRRGRPDNRRLCEGSQAFRITLTAEQVRVAIALGGTVQKGARLALQQFVQNQQKTA